MRKRVTVAIALSVGLSASGAVASQFHIQNESDAGRLILFDDGDRVATYAWRDPHVRRPYFANVFAPRGVSVTRPFPPRVGIDPADHDDMHPGIWLAFGDVSGADFWRGDGLVRHGGFLAGPITADNSVRFVVLNEYVHERKTICREQATHEIRRHELGYLFLFDSTFHAIERVEFGDQQEMGLGIRMATPLRVAAGSGRIVDSEGRVNESETWGERADWCDYSGTIDGRRVGVVLMPDPRNFRTSRFHSRDYGLTVANPFADHGFRRGEPRRTVVGPGHRFHIRFGVLVYRADQSGPIDASSVYRNFLRELGVPGVPSGASWRRHTIDDASQGADGVRAADVDGDGRADLTVGWEEGGEVRVYLNPGPGRVAESWPRVRVGATPSVEDAVFVDVDADGQLDVVASCEGAERSVYACLADGGADLLRSDGWTSSPFPALAESQRWMFALPIQVDDVGGVDLVLGSKGRGASVGWLRAPGRARRLSDWEWRPICHAGWIMSLRSIDVDADGDL
ncbi:MAG: DUF6807 family protein, partial [Planctomycetota bacterium]